MIFIKIVSYKISLSKLFKIWKELRVANDLHICYYIISISSKQFYFYIDGSKLPTSILTIFAHIVSVSKDHKSALIELLAKDSKYNQNEIYLTKILELWESELEWIKNKRSSDKINLIKAITNISEQGGRFDENTWQIIGNLFTTIFSFPRRSWRSSWISSFFVDYLSRLRLA